MKNVLIKYYPILINIYTVWILFMMFFAYNRGDIQTERYEIHPFPFESISSVITGSGSYLEIFKNIIGNIVLFMPYGFFGILYPKLNQYKYLFLAFFLGINYLEFSQHLFSRGFAEFDDVMLNVFGMSLGFMVYKFILKKF